MTIFESLRSHHIEVVVEDRHVFLEFRDIANVAAALFAYAAKLRRSEASVEAGVVVLSNGATIWHVPDNRTNVSLPDSPGLWDILREENQKGLLEGFAHSHPGSGIPEPSLEDFSTFSAIEAGLGRPLKWWICSSTHLVEFRRDPTFTFSGSRYACTVIEEAVPWLEELRRRSRKDS